MSNPQNTAISAAELKALTEAYKNAEPVIESAASFPQGDTKRSSAGGGGDNEGNEMMSLGIIKQGNKVYAYEADFDETSQKWYGEVSNRKGKTVHTTKAEFTTYQDAILAAQAWIKSKLDLE